MANLPRGDHQPSWSYQIDLQSRNIQHLVQIQWVSVKANLDSEIGRFGRMVRVGKNDHSAEM